jgi:hypothetical protein
MAILIAAALIGINVRRVPVGAANVVSPDRQLN